MSEPRTITHLTPGQTTTLGRLDKMRQAMNAAVGPKHGHDLAAEPLRVKAQFDQETGEYVIRIPSEVTGQNVEQTHGGRAMLSKIDVEFPRQAMIAIEWPEAPREETVVERGQRITRQVEPVVLERQITYHRLGGDKNDKQVSTISLLLGLYPNKQEARAASAGE